MEGSLCKAWLQLHRPFSRWHASRITRVSLVSCHSLQAVPLASPFCWREKDVPMCLPCRLKLGYIRSFHVVTPDGSISCDPFMFLMACLGASPKMGVPVFEGASFFVGFKGRPPGKLVAPSTQTRPIHPIPHLAHARPCWLRGSASGLRP